MGYIIDSDLLTVFLPKDKIQNIIEISYKVLKSKKILIRHEAQLVGLYSSARYAVTHAHLFHRYLDIDKTRALIQSYKNYNANMIISAESRSEIGWWLANVNSENGKVIREDPPSHSLHTLLVILKQVWLCCIRNNLYISAVHIPGSENLIPYNLSKCFKDTSEWKLKESIFCQVI